MLTNTIVKYNMKSVYTILFIIIITLISSCVTNRNIVQKINPPDFELNKNTLPPELTVYNDTNQNGLKTGIWIDTTITINYTTFKNGIKHGNYLAFSKTNNALITKGYFSNGLEIGTWIYYYKDHPKIKHKEGEFHLGHPIGLWKINTNKGKPLRNEVYTYNIDSTGTFTSYMTLIDSVEFIIKKGTFFNYKKHGQWLTYFRDQSIYRIENYKHGKKHGDFKLYFQNGSLKELTPYANDLIHGEVVLYSKNGTLKESTSYLNGLNDGEQIIYYKTGELKERIPYQNNKINGIYKGYDKLGNLFTVGLYKDGLKEGVWKSDPLDKKKYKKVYIYKNDKKHGQQITYNNFLQIIEESNYKNGVLDGKHIKYENGKCIEDYIYNKGLPTGKKASYDDNGNIKLSIEYIDGKNSGIYKRFFDNGQIAYEGNYKFGKKHGLVTEYYNNGRIKTLENYKHGKYHGKNIQYWNKAKPNIKTKTYYDENRIVGESYGYFKNGDVSLKNICKDSICVYTSYAKDKSIKQIGSSIFRNSVYQNHGILKSYHKTNILKSEYEYTNGKKIGTYKEYYDNGNISKLGYNDDKTKQWKSFNKNGDVLKESYHSKDSISTIKYNKHGDTTYYEGSKRYEGKQSISFRKKLNHNKQLITVSQTSILNNEIEEVSYFIKTGELKKSVWQTKDQQQLKHIEYNLKREVINKSQKTDGLKEGQWITSNVNGIYKEVVQYKNDKKEGPAKYYYPSGKLAKECNFKYDNLIGEYIKYHENGNIQEIGSNDPIKNKMTTKTFYSDGTLQSMEKPKSKLTRSYKSWFINGELDESYTKVFQSIYEQEVHGNYHGKYQSFYKNKQLHAIRHYVNDELHGKEKEYFENGNRKLYSFYKYGKMHGKWTYYYKNGMKYFECHYINNIKNGPFKSWYKNGQLNEKGTMKQDKTHGEWREYYENGKLKKTYSYILGSKSGDWVSYNINGDIIKRESYPESKNPLNTK